MSANVLPLPPSEPQALGFRPQGFERIRTALNAEIEAGKLPGAVLAIARQGRLAFFEAFGYLDRQAGTPMPVDAIFSIASMTKPLVSVAALALNEEGRMLVNAPVSSYLPQLARLSVARMRASPDGKGVLETVAPEREPTVRDLMRHTAGMTYGNRGNSEWHRGYLSSSDEVAAAMTGGEFLQQLASRPLHYQPGTAWDYGFGLDVLGLAIEAVTGQSLAQFLQERLFAPLAMIDSGFVVPPAAVHRFARGLPCDPLTGKPQAMRDSTRPHRFACGGGCAVSTAGDYLRFVQMLLDGGTLDGKRILGRKLVEYMTADHIGPHVDTTQLRAWPNIDGYGFGLGVAVRRDAGGGGMVSSRGEFHWAGSTGTYFWGDPAEGLAVVFMAHAPGRIRFYFRQLLHALVLQSLD
jgi:CubicO group peptidase (beta-lactamase class C family)